MVDSSWITNQNGGSKQGTTRGPLTSPEADPAEQTEEQQLPHLVQALLQGGEDAVLCEVEPQLQPTWGFLHGVPSVSTRSSSPVRGGTDLKITHLPQNNVKGLKAKVIN